jgi:hypothetical protein
MVGTPETAPEDRDGGMRQNGRPDPATDAFLAHRNLLFTVAYENPRELHQTGEKPQVV